MSATEGGRFNGAIVADGLIARMGAVLLSDHAKELGVTVPMDLRHLLSSGTCLNDVLLDSGIGCNFGLSWKGRGLRQASGAGDRQEKFGARLVKRAESCSTRWLNTEALLLVCKFALNLANEIRRGDEHAWVIFLPQQFAARTYEHEAMARQARVHT